MICTTEKEAENKSEAAVKRIAWLRLPGWFMHAGMLDLASYYVVFRASLGFVDAVRLSKKSRVILRWPYKQSFKRPQMNPSNTQPCAYSLLHILGDTYCWRTWLRQRETNYGEFKAQEVGLRSYICSSTWVTKSLGNSLCQCATNILKILIKYIYSFRPPV